MYQRIRFLTFILFYSPYMHNIHSLSMLGLCLHSEILTTFVTPESWFPKCTVQLNEWQVPDSKVKWWYEAVICFNSLYHLEFNQPRNSFCPSLKGNTVIQSDNKHQTCYVNRFLRLMVCYQSYTCEPDSHDVIWMVFVNAVITDVQAWIPQVFVTWVTFHSCRLHYSFLIHAHNKRVIWSDGYIQKQFTFVSIHQQRIVGIFCDN
jgi:hypothetical protein